MIMLINFPLEPLDETVARTRIFFIDAVKVSKGEVERAEARLDDALRNYIEDDWEGGTVIRLAEDNLAKAEAEHDANVARLDWESSRLFAREIKPDRPMLTPWIHSAVAWLKIFAHYKLARPTPNETT